MTPSKRFGIVLAAGMIVIGASEMGERLALPGIHSLIPTAEAVVGRPATPVSVAGVARRTARRN
jgi:hypothetical protein